MVVRLSAWALILVSCPLGGCASSSGVFQVGPNTYQITTSAFTSSGGVGAARASAIQAANEYCERSGKHPFVLDTANDSQFTQGSSDIKFRCEL